MKKKIALLLSIMFAFALMLGACGTDPTTVDYNGYTYDQLSATSAGLIEALSQMGEDEMAYYLQSGDSFSASIITAWSENTADLGDYQGYGDFSVTKSGNTVTADMIVQFEKRNAVFEVVYDLNDMSIPTGVTVEPIQTLGEKMSRAGMNTLISICIVFAMLILISLIIYAFKVFPYLEERKKKNAAPTAPAAPAANMAVQRQQQPAAVAEQTDDSELIAVIAAAIAASEGTSTSGFVVRSINRR